MNRRKLFVLLSIILFAFPVVSCCDYIKGASYFAQGKYALAIKEYEEELRLDPAYVQGHYVVGLCYARLKNYDKAIESLKKAQALDRKDFQISLALAQAYFDAAQYGELTDALGTATMNARAPADLEKIRFLKAAALFNQQDYAQAIPELKSAVTAQPHNAALQAQLGIAFYHLQKYDEAAAALTIATSINPDDAQAGLFLGETMFARAAQHTQLRERTRGLNESLKIAEKWAEKQPQNYDALSLAGRASLALKNHAQAVVFLKRASDVRPNSATTLFSLGQAYALSGQYAEAEEALTRASQNLTSEATLFSMLGFVLEKQNKLEGAAAAYERAQSLSPSAESQASLERIKQKQSRQNP
jgi:tetratricopeptide (TPR) repeat protein